MVCILHSLIYRVCFCLWVRIVIFCVYALKNNYRKGIDTLLAPGGWIDSEMTAGSSGSILILKKV